MWDDLISFSYVDNALINFFYVDNALINLSYVDNIFILTSCIYLTEPCDFFLI